MEESECSINPKHKTRRETSTLTRSPSLLHPPPHLRQRPTFLTSWRTSLYSATSSILTCNTSHFSENISSPRHLPNDSTTYHFSENSPLHVLTHTKLICNTFHSSENISLPRHLSDHFLRQHQDHFQYFFGMCRVCCSITMTLRLKMWTYPPMISFLNHSVSSIYKG